MKKTWCTPQVIELYRGRPEENVLQACKHPNLNYDGPTYNIVKCSANLTGEGAGCGGACADQGSGNNPT